MTAPKSPEECETMAEVRAGVDDVDRQIVTLIARRFGYMDAAARIKIMRSEVRDETRKAEVLENVRDLASQFGLRTDLIGALYEQLIEASIKHELELFDAVSDNEGRT